ncbi:SMI1 / KNR4 family (SUKH-1) [Chryseobacterium taeanense]|uniref:SMI1 / KNR4 family (SUKH-1) n=1 Tax=Chryseobacterium taeanense TaxID=311334 RepID=A0A1G8KYV2_9FLAO|nr:SMI1/KNR4 family protein [Chryseobacterium taeanense]SDI48586.1 SMI1 / KNR4 family (SUKH-1) [Chryseobacterium taeanense]
MQIEYLKKMKNTPIIKGNENKGNSETEIEKLEQKLNIKFPKAYKEFLFLGGKYQNCIDDWNTDSQYLDWMQENIKESMDEVNLDLKPFFAFANYERDQCLFFFLNGDENPPVYAYYEDKIEEEGKEVFYSKFRNSFSEYIDRSIDYALSK